LGSTFEQSLINTPTGLGATLTLTGSLGTSLLNNGIKDALNCALPGALSQSQVAKLLLQLAGWGNPAMGIWKAISVTVSAAGPANETALTWYYWGASQPVGICEAAGAVVNCAASFNIPSPGQLSVGSTANLVPQALDALARPTLYSVYSTLFWSSTNQAVATVVKGGTVTAVAAGATTISATDLFTGATGAVTVTVGSSAPSLVGTYKLVSLRGGLCIPGGGVCSPAAATGNLCFYDGVMTIDASGNWSYYVEATIPCVGGAPQAVFASSGGVGTGTYLTAAIEADTTSAICPTLGDYLGAGSYCTEYPAGYYYFPVGVSSVAADPTGTNLISNFGGDTVWVRQ